MSTISFTFNTDDRFQQMSAMRCMKALDMALALFEIKELTYKDEIDIDSFKDEIINIFDNRNINLEEIVE